MKSSRKRDFDPESLLDPAPSSSNEDSDSESEDESQAGREHYIDVAPSKLRKRDVAPLGPQYKAALVSRDNVEDEDSEDPFAGRFDSEDHDSQSDESDAEDGGRNGDDEDAFDEEEGDGEGEEDEDENRTGSEEDDASESESEGGDAAESRWNPGTELQQLMTKEQATVAATLSQAVKADIEKGKAVKTQRQTYDVLLNTRIRLQKALISTNSMATLADNQRVAEEPAIRAAEAAALSLLTTLSNLQHALNASRIGEKRKSEVAFASDTESSEIWKSIQSVDSKNHNHRNGVLEKWSARTKATPVLAASKGRLNQTAQQTITDVLQAQLADPDRLVKRTKIARSCAPTQSAAGIHESDDIYDDADFYGLLLKELLERRSQDLIANGMDSGLVIEAPWQATKAVKSKKVVDTKASKGRKLRYTVHEKLQNLVAPESRGTWGTRQREELFSSLFGKRGGLREELDEDEDVRSENGAEEEGLKLFRS